MVRVISDYLSVRGYIPSIVISEGRLLNDEGALVGSPGMLTFLSS